MSPNRLLALGVMASAVILLAAATAFSELVSGVPAEMRMPRVAVFAILAFAVAVNGAVILWHRPRNRIGWVLCASGVVGCAEHLVGSYAAAAIFGGALPLGSAAAWIFSWLETLHLGTLGTFAFLLFPDGRLPSARWRPVAWSAAVGMAAVAVGIALRPEPVPVIGVPNPLGIPELEGATLGLVSIGLVLIALSSLLCALSLFLRYRRSSGTERQQIKWVAFAGVFLVWPVVATVVLGVPLDLGALIASFAAVPLPTAMTIALIRYRLYDIDLLINRTVVYGTVTAILGTAFLIVTAAAQRALVDFTGQRSDLATAAIGLGLALLFPRMRRRMTPVVDRFLPARELLTVLFTDIVGSTIAAAELGDERWRTLLERYRVAVRHELRQFHGREIDTAGDGFFATFVSPTQALRCAVSIANSIRALGLRSRTGLHRGPCEMRGEKVSGLTLHVGARVMGLARDDEVLLTSSVRDVVENSEIRFEDRGTHALRGVPEAWRLYAAGAT